MIIELIQYGEPVIIDDVETRPETVILSEESDDPLTLRRYQLQAALNNRDGGTDTYVGRVRPEEPTT